MPQLKLHLVKSLLLSLILCSAGSAYATSKALIVGVGKYKNPDNDLPGIDLDVDMAQQIAQRLGVNSKNMQFLRDEAASIQGMRNGLKWLSQDVNEADRVVIYVSSHGSYVPDKNGDEKDGVDETLYLYDGHFIDDELYQALRKIPSKNVIVIVDACHSGTGTRAFKENAFNITNGKVKAIAGLGAKAIDNNVSSSYNPQAITDSSEQDNYISMGAAQDNQQSVATERGSLFTLALLEILERARNKNKNASWQEIFSQTKQRVMATGQGFYPNLDGNPQLANLPALVTPVSNNPTTVSPTNNNQPIWNSLLQLAQSGTKFDLVAPNKLKLQDKLQININPPIEGYLNIITVGPEDNATLLFPNQYEQNNLIKKGKIVFPSPSSFVIRAVPPKGKLLVAAFITKQPINLLHYGLGNRDDSGKLNSLFSNVQRAGFNMLNPAMIANPSNAILPKSDLYAAYAEINIE
ncbi:MAG TPA: caspase family protein [Agitococcus sp.]|nr:caspase family protein [Agitococcus sp.]HNN28881.1 caspase family protein [Agitococcus sp.]